MAKNYQRDHEEIVWSEAIPDLNICELAADLAPTRTLQEIPS